MPLQQWAALYSAAHTRKLEWLLNLLSVLHAKDPRQVQYNLKSQIGRIERPGVPSVYDAEGLKRFVSGIPGVVVKVEEKPKPDADRS